MNGIVYIGSFDDKVYALDATTGAVKWTATTGGAIFSSPSVANGVVYIGSEDDKVYALDATTGAVKWTRRPAPQVLSSPAVANGVVYIGSNDDKLYALDAATGAVEWTATTGATVESSPAVANGSVYVGSIDAKLWAFDAATGATKWTGATTGAIYSSPAVANGVVYVGSNDGKCTRTRRGHSPGRPAAANPNPGISPCQIQDAYRLPSQLAGAGRTVAIVDAFDNPNAEADLAVYRTSTGCRRAPPPTGASRSSTRAGVAGSYPAGEPGWGIEISLDVDAVSAICPLCHITLVEANSNSDPRPGRRRGHRRRPEPDRHLEQLGGRSELAGEHTLRRATSPTPGIPTTVSTGDSGYGTSGRPLR